MRLCVRRCLSLRQAGAGSYEHNGKWCWYQAATTSSEEKKEEKGGGAARIVSLSTSSAACGAADCSAPGVGQDGYDGMHGAAWGACEAWGTELRRTGNE